MSTIVVVPTYNEADNVRAFIDSLLNLPSNFSILIVDDSSPDGTGQIADAIARESARVTVMHRAAKEGLGKAYVAAFEYVLPQNFDFVVQMDVDGSHDPKDLMNLLNNAHTADCVIGSRWVKGGRVEGWPFHRMLISRAGNYYVQAMLKLGVRDATAGFRVYSASALRNLDLSQISASGYGFQVEMTFRLRETGKTFLEVPITFKERELGTSKMTLRIILEALVLVTRWRFGKNDL